MFIHRATTFTPNPYPPSPTPSQSPTPLLTGCTSHTPLQPPLLLQLHHPLPFYPLPLGIANHALVHRLNQPVSRERGSYSFFRGLVVVDRSRLSRREARVTAREGRFWRRGTWRVGVVGFEFEDRRRKVGFGRDVYLTPKILVAKDFEGVLPSTPSSKQTRLASRHDRCIIRSNRTMSRVSIHHPVF